jgi:hypothetical protein
MATLDIEKLKVLIEMDVLPNKETFLAMVDRIQELESRIDGMESVGYHVRESARALDKALDTMTGWAGLGEGPMRPPAG